MPNKSSGNYHSNCAERGNIMKKTAIVTVFLALCSAAIAATFAETPSYQTKLTCPLSIVFGDLNGDGKPDMLVNTYGEKWDGKEGKILIYYNKDGNFPEKADRSIELPYCFRMAIYDFDGDGKNDIAMVGDGRNLCFLLNKDGFDPVKRLKFNNTNQSNGTIQICKINNKGDFDALVGPVWRKFFRAKDCAFRADTGYILGPRINDTWVTLAIDVDSDGEMDVVGSGRQDNTLRVYYGPLLDTNVNPEQLKEFLELHLPGNLSGFTVGDLNCDNLNDLVVTDAKNHKTYIYFQNEPVGFDINAKPSLTINGGGSVYIEDLDNDKLSDLIILDNNESLAVFLQRKDAPFPTDILKADQVVKIPKSDFICFADTDGDGVKDMVVKNTYSGQIQIYSGIKKAADLLK